MPPSQPRLRDALSGGIFRRTSVVPDNAEESHERLVSHVLRKNTLATAHGLMVLEKGRLDVLFLREINDNE